MTSLGGLTGFGNEQSGITVNNSSRNNKKNHRGSLMQQRKNAGNNRIGGNSPAVTVPAMQAADKNMMNKAKNTLNRLMKQAGLKSNNKANATEKMNKIRIGGRRTRKRRRKRGRVGKKGYSHPKRGQKSRTRKGNKDFTTKKGNKVFHRRRHYVRKSRKPYRKLKKRRTSKKQIGRGMGWSKTLCKYGIEDCQPHMSPSVEALQPQFNHTLAVANIANQGIGLAVGDFPSCDSRQCNAWPKSGPSPTSPYRTKKPNFKNAKKKTPEEKKALKEYQMWKKAYYKTM